MKKTYIIPTLNVVKVLPMQLLTVNSIPTSEENADPELGMSARRSRFSTWEEEEFE